MEKQITVRIPRKLDRALRAAARRSQRRPSEIVRRALERYLELQTPQPGTAYEKIRDLIGAFDSGIPDLAERHSEYVYESLRRGR